MKKKVVFSSVVLSSLVQPPALDSLLDLRLDMSLGIPDASAAAGVRKVPVTVPSLRGVYRLEKPVQYASFEGAKEAFVELVIMDARPDLKDLCARGKSPMFMFYRLIDVQTGNRLATTSTSFVGLMTGVDAAPNRYTVFYTSTGYCVESFPILDFSKDFKQVVVDMSLYGKYGYAQREIGFMEYQTRPALRGPQTFIRVK